MNGIKNRGQGATEYLLILAAVLVVVAVAVYYVTRAGAAAPNLTLMPYARGENIYVRATTTSTDTVKAGDWEYVVYLQGEPAPAATTGTFDLTPNTDTLLTSVTQSGTYVVRIRHKPSGKFLVDTTVSVSL
jgi:hypothetical protein